MPWYRYNSANHLYWSAKQAAWVPLVEATAYRRHPIEFAPRKRGLPQEVTHLEIHDPIKTKADCVANGWHSRYMTETGRCVLCGENGSGEVVVKSKVPLRPRPKRRQRRGK